MHRRSPTGENRQNGPYGDHCGRTGRQLAETYKTVPAAGDALHNTLLMAYGDDARRPLSKSCAKPSGNFLHYRSQLVKQQNTDRPARLHLSLSQCPPQRKLDRYLRPQLAWR